MKKRFSKILLSFILLPSFAYSADLELFSSVDLFSYSDANIHEDDWLTLGPYQPGEVSFIYSTAEVGFKWRNWKLSGISRFDYWTEFNEETGELLYLKGNSYTPEQDRMYNLDITANHIRAHGIKLAYEWLPFEDRNFVTSFAVSYLNADQLIDGQINGQAKEVSEDRYQGDLYIDFDATEDLIFQGLEAEAQGGGRGVTLDFGLQWHIDQIADITLNVTDLFSEIKWNDVQYSDYRANPRPAEIVDGKLYTYATIEGNRGHGDYQQTLPRRIELQGRYLLFRHLHLLAEINHFEPVTIPRLGISLSFTPNTHMDFYHSSFTGANEVAFYSKYLWLSIQADKSIEGAEALDKLLTAGVKIGFSISLY